MPAGAEPGAVDFHRLDLEVLVTFPPRGVGYEHPDDEPPAGCEVIGDVLEATLLRFDIEEREERVERDEHKGERSVHVDVGEVADRDRNVVAAGFGPELVDHRLRRVDAVHLQPPVCERKGQSARTDAELEHRSGAGEAGEAGHRFVVGPVHAVVHVGDLVAVGGGVVTFP